MNDSLKLNAATLKKLAALKKELGAKGLSDALNKIGDLELLFESLLETGFDGETKQQFFANRTNKKLAGKKLTEQELIAEARANSTSLEFVQQAILHYATFLVSSKQKPLKSELRGQLEAAFKKFEKKGEIPLQARLRKETGINMRTIKAFLKDEHPEIHELSIRLGVGRKSDEVIRATLAEIQAEKAK